MITKKRTPKISEDKIKCCGCSVCSHNCPVDAITMKTDANGFIYPEINLTKCVYCYQCERVCLYLV